MDARTALAEAISAENGTEVTPELMEATDKILIRLWVEGYGVFPVHPEYLEKVQPHAA